MKQFFKNTAYLILFSSITMYGEQCYDAGDVIVACPEYSVNTELKLLFLKPSTNNLYYAAEAFPLNNAFATPGASPNWKTFDLHPKYHVAFDLGWRAIFHSKGTNLYVNWERFNSSTCSSLVVSSNEDMVGPFSSIGPDASPYKQVAGNVHLKFNEVNIRYGQYLDIGTDLHTNLFVGISYAHLKQNLTTLFSNIDKGISRTTTVPSSFKGAGPQCGLDFNYNVTKGLKLTGLFTAALLMGKVKNHTGYASTSPELANIGNPPINPQSISQCSRTQMIPDLGQRIGLAYECSCDHFGTQVELGWDSKILLNAIQSNDLSSGVIDVTPYPNTVGVFARTFARTLGNFSLGGPYLGFNIGF